MNQIGRKHILHDMTDQILGMDGQPVQSPSPHAGTRQTEPLEERIRKVRTMNHRPNIGFRGKVKKWAVRGVLVAVIGAIGYHTLGAPYEAIFNAAAPTGVVAGTATIAALGITHLTAPQVEKMMDVILSTMGDKDPAKHNIRLLVQAHQADNPQEALNNLKKQGVIGEIEQDYEAVKKERGDLPFAKYVQLRYEGKLNNLFPDTKLGDPPITTKQLPKSFDSPQMQELAAALSQHLERPITVQDILPNRIPTSDKVLTGTTDPQVFELLTTRAKTNQQIEIQMIAAEALQTYTMDPSDPVRTLAQKTYAQGLDHSLQQEDMSQRPQLKQQFDANGKYIPMSQRGAHQYNQNRQPIPGSQHNAPQQQQDNRGFWEKVGDGAWDVTTHLLTHAGKEVNRNAKGVISNEISEEARSIARGGKGY